MLYDQAGDSSDGYKEDMCMSILVAHFLKELQQDIQQRPSGAFAQPYYRWLGMKANTGRISRDRALGIATLLSAPQPYIYPHDLIVGSLRPLFASVPEEELTAAQEGCARYGERTFATNADHFAPDYRTLLTLGLPGLLTKIQASKEAHVTEPEAVAYLEDMAITLRGLSDMIQGYAQEAEAMRAVDAYTPAVLDRIAADCRALTQGAPQSFAQALQLVWFCHLSFCMEMRYAMALGRMDQYLYPFYFRDVQAGRLSEAEATALLANTFAKIQERRVLFGGDDVVNICLGGMNQEGECQLNRLSYCILHAVDLVHVPGPNLSVRVTPDTPDDFLDECLQVIGTGLGYPALMNDTVNLAALRRYGYAEEDLYDYCMVGCIENFITGAQPAWTDGRFDTPRFLEYLFHHGKGILQSTVGVDTGDVEEITSMQELMERLEVQLKAGVAAYMEGFLASNRVAEPQRFTSPFLSCFCRDCIARGKDINDGGSRYPSVHGAALMGVGTMCDSLAAIEQVVFTDHAATLGELRDALLCNFEGKETLRQALLAVPKYGNNHPMPDKYAAWFVRFLSEAFDSYRTPDGGGVYIAMAANISNIYAGRTIAATPDGRLAGEPLSDAASPTYGRDTHGVTSTLLSLTKPDYTRVACGTVVNQKFSPAMFNDQRRPKLLALIKTYFGLGGQELQINATSREVLKDAMMHPEKYPTMVVRVSGFSAVYVTLDRAVQEDILHRTQHEA